MSIMHPRPTTLSQQSPVPHPYDACCCQQSNSILSDTLAKMKWCLLSTSCCMLTGGGGGGADGAGYPMGPLRMGLQASSRTNSALANNHSSLSTTPMRSNSLATAGSSPLADAGAGYQRTPNMRAGTTGGMGVSPSASPSAPASAPAGQYCPYNESASSTAAVSPMSTPTKAASVLSRRISGEVSGSPTSAGRSSNKQHSSAVHCMRYTMYASGRVLDNVV